MRFVPVLARMSENLLDNCTGAANPGVAKTRRAPLGRALLGAAVAAGVACGAVPVAPLPALGAGAGMADEMLSERKVGKGDASISAAAGGAEVVLGKTAAVG